MNLAQFAEQEWFWHQYRDVKVEFVHHDGSRTVRIFFDSDRANLRV